MNTTPSYTMTQTEFFFNETENLTHCFEPISLKEMDSVKLMDRVDVKYVIPIQTLPKVLFEAQTKYRILEVGNKRLCNYETLYYDTADLQLYNHHLKNRANRYKIRSRNYVDSDLRFFEVKFKNNKGRTIKTRIKRETINQQMDIDSAEFLKQSTPLSHLDFTGIIWVDYTRITLVSKQSLERLTIDLKLTFRNNRHQKAYPEIAIAEVKQEKSSGSPFIDIMKQFHIRQGSISKYCFGIISLYEGIPYNTFKPNLQRIHKLINQYDFAPGNNLNRPVSMA